MRFLSGFLLLLGLGIELAVNEIMILICLIKGIWVDIRCCWMVQVRLVPEVVSPLLSLSGSWKSEAP